MGNEQSSSNSPFSPTKRGSIPPIISSPQSATTPSPTRSSRSPRPGSSRSGSARDSDLPPPPYSPVDPTASSPPIRSSRSSVPVIAPPIRRSRSTHEQPRTDNSSVSNSASLQPSNSLQVPNGQHSHRRTVSQSGSHNLPSLPGGFVVEMLPGSSSNPPLPPGSSHTRVTQIPAGSGISSGAGQTPARRNSREDPLELLKKYDTVLVVDDSSSMEGALWLEAREALAGVADAAARYGLNGVDVHFLNDRRTGFNLRSSAEVKRLFDRITPTGITPTGEKLEELLLDYLLKLEKAKDASEQGDTDALKSVRPVNFIILTDGAPTDDPESVIITAARRLDARNFPLSQLGIQFVQIGNDPSASEALAELDDGLAAAHGVRDIVDTTPFSARGSQLTAETLTKILLGGINRRVDRRG